MDAIRFIDKIKKIQVPERYSMRMSEIKAIYEVCANEFDIMTAAFSYGFLKGQRFALRYPQSAPTGMGKRKTAPDKQ